MLQKDKRKSKGTGEENKNEFMKPVNVTPEDSSDEMPSIEKHGFMMYPPGVSKENNVKGKGRSSSKRCVPSSFPVFACSCCGCVQKPRCPCSQFPWSPMQYYSPMQYSPMQYSPMHSPMFYATEQSNAQERTRFGDQKKKRATQSERREKTNPDSFMEAILEKEGRRDMELASIMVNDARSGFRTAVSEEYSPQMSPSSEKNQSIQSQGLNTFWVNKAAENFDRIVKDEKDDKLKNRPSPNLQERKKSATTPKRRGKKNQQGPLTRSVMNDIVENDGRMDQELASIMVNDARSGFRNAISDESPKMSISSDKNESVKSRGLEMFRVNKASENFDRIAKEETNKTNVKGNERIQSRGLETFRVNKASENFDRIAKDENDDNVKKRSSSNQSIDSKDRPKVNWSDYKSLKKKK